MPSTTNKTAVIIGSGIAGLTTARLLNENGFDVTVVEKSSKIGGHVGRWSCKATSECQACHCCSLSDVTAALDDLTVRFLTGCQLESVTKDSNGSLTGVSLVKTDSNGREEIPANALVLSTGFETFDPSEKTLWGYGVFDGVMTLAELDDIMREDRLSEIGNGQKNSRIAFFQCVGSRDKSIGANFCSQYCCKAALRSAIKIKTEMPDCDVSLFYIDLQVAGKYATSLLGKARQIGVDLAQGVPGEILPEENKKLTVILERNGLNTRDQFDKIILSVGQRPNNSSVDISRMTGVELDQFGFFQRLTELDRFRTKVKGVYLAGACGGPMDIETTILSAAGAASDVIADFSS